MTPRGGSPDVMRDLLEMSERETDLLLQGRTERDDASFRAVAGFFADAASTFPLESPPPEVEAAHLSAIRAAIEEALPPSPAPYREPPKRGRRTKRRARLRPTMGLGFVTAVVLTGMAFAGVLPPPIQATASDIAKRIGFDLPSPEDPGRTTGDAHGGEVGDTRVPLGRLGSGSGTEPAGRAGTSGDNEATSGEGRRQPGASGEGDRTSVDSDHDRDGDGPEGSDLDERTAAGDPDDGGDQAGDPDDPDDPADPDDPDDPADADDSAEPDDPDDQDDPADPDDPDDQDDPADPDDGSGGDGP